MPPVIHVENLSKRYRIRHGRLHAGYRTLRETLSDIAVAPLRRLREGKSNGRIEEFWALKDINLDVQRGEVVGIIGRNGAGKSTFLKILSRITAPTTGQIELRGRVGSLLEVGTGFHPELTGRENIYLNGSILGMGRRIRKKFDEIVEFSGVERFLDTPVKRYSSGMSVRLAFAIAAHLDPEIVIVDEVLAVGDLEFQRKCLGRMRDVAQAGRTALFVSHNMAAIQSLCNRCVVLDSGRSIFDGDVDEGIRRYVQCSASHVVEDLRARRDRKGNGEIRLESVVIQDAEGNNTGSVPMGGTLRIVVGLRCHGTKRPHFGIAVFTSLGQRIFRLNSGDQGVTCPAFEGGGTLVCEVPCLPLLPDIYAVTLSVADEKDNLQDEVQNAIAFDVVGADVFGTGRIPHGPGDILFVASNWDLTLRE